MSARLAHPDAAAPLPSLRVRAYERFRDHILKANIQPGQVLSQRELTVMLGVPLAAVRELIPRLEAEGLLRTMPQRGLQIAHVDLKLVHNAFNLRRMLEAEAGARFAKSVSDADLERIEQAHWRIVQRAREGSIDARLLEDATAVDWGLHDLMIDALGNELVAEIYRVNSLRIRLIRLEGSLMSADVLLPVMAEHLHIVEALKAHDPALTVQRISDHIDSACKRVLGVPQPAAPPLPVSSRSGFSA